jgi:hypothetical protein
MSRRGDTYPSLVLALLFSVGVAWALFSLAVMRAARLAGAGDVPALTLLLCGWVLVVAVGIAIGRGARVERLAALALAGLRPVAPLLADGRVQPNYENRRDHLGPDAELVASIVDWTPWPAPRTGLAADADFGVETQASRYLAIASRACSIKDACARCCRCRVSCGPRPSAAGCRGRAVNQLVVETGDWRTSSRRDPGRFLGDAGAAEADGLPRGRQR